MKGVILFGGFGRLGSEIRAVLEERGIPHIALPKERGDVNDPGVVRNLNKLLSLQFDVQADTVINCTAFHDTKACETDASQAFYWNAELPRDLARQAASVNAKFVHVSTDYVFGGLVPKSLSGYTSDDAPAPINTYGASKAAGELLVMASAYDSLIVRVASLFGSPDDRGDFVKLVRGRVASGDAMTVVDDVTMSPTYTRDAALALLDSLISIDCRGISHLVNSGEPATWYEFARHIATLCNAPTEFLTPTTLAESGDPLPRPPSSALVPCPLIALPDWRTSVESYLNRLDNE